MINLYKNPLLSKDTFRTNVTEEDMNEGIFTDDGCVYSSDGLRLLKYMGCWDDELTIEVADVNVICDNAFPYNLKKIILPTTLRIIGNNAFPYCEIISKSPSFIIENGILYSADKKRLIVKCLNKDTVFYLPEEVSQVDTCAFRRDDSENEAPYYLKMSTSNVNKFNCGKIIASDQFVMAQLILNGFSKSQFVEGDIFVDKEGVVYSADKKTLLCYPRELRLKTYEILENCEHIAENAFGGYEDPDEDGTVYRNGNCLRVLVLPPHLKSISPWSFEGCFCLKAIVFNQKEERQVRKLLNTLEGYYIKHMIESLIYIPVYYEE